MAQATLVKRMAGGERTQLARLLDVFVFGPLMIVAARDQESPYFRTALTLVGLGTIAYNGARYLQAMRESQAQPTELGQQIAQRANPLTAKGEKILAAMQASYGPRRGAEVFYASEKAGTITGVHK